MAQAEREFLHALELEPDHPLALAGLGIVRFRLGRHDEAIVLLRRAVSRAPGEAAIANTLGEFLCLTGRFEEALPPLRRAAGIEPREPAIQLNLGNALSGVNRYEEALDCYRRAVAGNPKIREAHNNAGLMLAALGRHDEAAVHYRNALACDPGYREARINLGITLDANGRLEEALAAFDTVIAADPHHGQAQMGRGMVLRELGRVEEARAALERAVALEPGNPMAQRALADAKQFLPGDPQIAQMEAILKHADSLSHEERINLHTALARAYDDLGRYAEAFANMKQGKALWRSTVRYDEVAELSSFAAIAKLFTPEVLQALQGCGHPSELPVFILGMPRSGSTLVEQILAAHPKVFGAGEIGDFGVAAGGGYAPSNRTSFARTAEEVSGIGARYAEKLRTLAPQAERIVDKQPANFFFAGLIHLALPRARIVHVRRDPRDICLSCYAQVFTSAIPYNGDLGELGRYTRAYGKLMAHWRAALPSGAMLEIDYEDIVRDFQTQARRLVEFCGLDWDERCLDFHNVERPVFTSSAYQVRRPLYAGSVGRWRHYQEWLGPLFEALEG